MVPWGAYRLTIDAAWLKVSSTASAPIYQTPWRQNPEFFSLLAPLINASRGGLIVDVGANIGVYVLGIRAATQAPIVAMEPDPSLFALLAANTDGNELHGISINNYACGDAPGYLRFHGGINGSVAGEADASGAILVPVVRLDDELRDAGAIDLVKIDCEGYEWHVVTGCRRILAQQRPALFIELHPRLIGRYHRTIAEVLDLLRPQYRLEFYDLNPAQRSRSRLVRFISRYKQRLIRLAGEAQALELSASATPPDQIFLVARPLEQAT